MDSQSKLMQFLSDSPKTITKKVQKSDEETELDFGGKKIYRIQNVQRFHLAFKEDFKSFEELLKSIDYSDIIQLNYNSDLTECIIIYRTEVKYVDRKEHDQNLPETNQPPNPNLQELSNG